MSKTVLTAKAVEKMKADPTRRLEIPDGIVPGLFLVVQPSGVKSWALRYRVGGGRAGKTRKHTLGRVPTTELGDARKAARLLLEDIAKGIDPAIQPEPVPIPQITTVEQAVARFLKAQTAKGLRSVDEQGRVLKRHLVAAIGDKDVRSIERRDVYALLEGMRDARTTVEVDGVATEVPKYRAQVNRVLTLCKTFFGWAVEAGEIAGNPAMDIKRMVVEQSRERALSAEEMAKVIRAADSDDYPVGPLVRFMLLTAVRREEATRARWAEFDLEAGLWTIPAERTKPGREHRVPLSTAALSLLDGLPRWTEGDYLFSASAGKHFYAGWRKAAGRIEKAAGLSADWVVHDLRRTVATRMGEDLDIDESIISRILNHSSKGRLGVTSVYERSRRERAMRAALEAWGYHVTHLPGA
ncbi:tyrosine-type recombinase/integrase [Azospirillum argentinense]